MKTSAPHLLHWALFLSPVSRSTSSFFSIFVCLWSLKLCSPEFLSQFQILLKVISFNLNCSAFFFSLQIQLLLLILVPFLFYLFSTQYIVDRLNSLTSIHLCLCLRNGVPFFCTNLIAWLSFDFFFKWNLRIFVFFFWGLLIMISVKNKTSVIYLLFLSRFIVIMFSRYFFSLNELKILSTINDIFRWTPTVW